jgi:signal transduction histidine kinase
MNREHAHDRWYSACGCVSLIGLSRNIPPLHTIRFQIQFVFELRLMLTNEIAMESRLSLIPSTIEKLRSNPELRSRLDGRNSAFYIAMSEALANAVTHGNRNAPSRKVYVRWTCEPDGALSILIRDEGTGFNPGNIVPAQDTDEDRNRGIRLMRSYMDDVQFRNNGTEVYMRMNGPQWT